MDAESRLLDRGTICRKLRGNSKGCTDNLPSQTGSRLTTISFFSGKLVVIGVVFLKMWSHSDSIYMSEIIVREQEPSFGKGRAFALQYAIVELNGVFRVTSTVSWNIAPLPARNLPMK